LRKHMEETKTSLPVFTLRNKLGRIILGTFMLWLAMGLKRNEFWRIQPFVSVLQNTTQMH